jgi:hypothetical protein
MRALDVDGPNVDVGELVFQTISKRKVPAGSLQLRKTEAKDLHRSQQVWEVHLAEGRVVQRLEGTAVWVTHVVGSFD